MKQKFVRIQSTMTINVTSGLQAMDVTDETAYVANKMRVSPTWTLNTVLIKQGVGNYPSDIAEWATVKALVKDGVLTIGGFADDATEEEKELYEKFMMNKDEMELKTTVTETNNQKYQEQKKKAKEIKLTDIAGD